MKTIRVLARYLFVLLTLLFAASILLFAAGLLPQNRIEANLVDSLYQIEEEGRYPHILDENSWSHMIDMYSESYILNLSYYMDTAQSPSSIFSNPNRENATGTAFSEIVVQHLGSDASYERYWAGFRTTGRLLLTFFTYPEIRRIVSVGFLMLAGATGLYLFSRTKSAAAGLSFLLMLGLLNPSVVSSTLQFSCCFFIAMIGTLLLPRQERRFLTYPMYFFILGALTQYFDFYTTPILTYGIPMLALLFILQRENNGLTGKNLFRLSGVCFGSWLSAYILMWIGKLSLTTLFTGFNAFGDGFGSAVNRLFYSTGDVDAPLPYRMVLAIWRSFMRVFDKPIFLALALLALAAVWLFLFLRRKKTVADLLSSSVYLFIAAIPLVWFIAVSGPSLRHSWFQYRGIGVFLFGILLFVIQSTQKQQAAAAQTPVTAPPQLAKDQPLS